MFDINWQELILSLPAILIALTCHEYAHARAAYALGDNTANYLGRLTLNPLKHLDPAGTLMLIFFRFGWAKPVPVNPYNLKIKNKHFGMTVVSIAGPLMNLLLAMLGGLLVFAFFKLYDAFWYDLDGSAANLIISLYYFLLYFIQINVILAIFNLLPVPPLDGSKILAGILPPKWADIFYKYERYGSIIMILLLVTGALGRLILPVVSWLTGLIYSAAIAF